MLNCIYIDLNWNRKKLEREYMKILSYLAIGLWINFLKNIFFFAVSQIFYNKNVFFKLVKWTLNLIVIIYYMFATFSLNRKIGTYIQATMTI